MVVWAKNVKTLWREAEKLIGEDGALQMVDPLHVIESVMRYFFSLAQSGHKANTPLDEVRKCFREAAQLAALAAPYRHPRLSAVKHIEQGDTIDGISANATPEELRAEIAKRIALLRDKGYVDLEALPPPANGKGAQQMLKETKKITKRARTKAMPRSCAIKNAPGANAFLMVGVGQSWCAPDAQFEYLLRK